MKRYQALATSSTRAAVILPDGEEVYFAVGRGASADCVRTAIFMNQLYEGRRRFSSQGE